MRLSRLLRRSMPRLAEIRNQGYIVRYYRRAAGAREDSPAWRARSLAIKRMAKAIRDALDAGEDPEAVLTAAFESLNPRDDTPPF